MADRGRLVVVDDDEDLLALLEIRLSDVGYAVSTTPDSSTAQALIHSVRPDLVLTDLRMGEIDGHELLDRLRRDYPSLPVVMMTAHGTIPDAVKATHAGAFAFITKPIDTPVLLATLDKALATYGGTLPSSAGQTLIARSPPMSDLLARVQKVAPTNAAVLIRGETGSGKDRIAQLLHESSDRCEAAYVPVNCGAIPESLFEAELFGYVKGAFTNAARARDGLMVAADGGTLFLDEIGELPLPMQVKLLRALETGEVRAVGSDHPRSVNVRVLAATNRDLQQAIADGDFREDLYYRLNVVSLELPPLRSRPEDIPALVALFLQSESSSTRPAPVYAPEAMALLVNAPWPGNIRQLRNMVAQNTALAASPVITAADVREALGDQAPPRPKSYDEARDAFTRDYLLQLLRLTEGNVSKAARLAKRNRTDFYKLMERHGVDRSDVIPDQE